MQIHHEKPLSWTVMPRRVQGLRCHMVPPQMAVVPAATCK